MHTMWCLERHVEVGVSGQPVNFLPRLLSRPKRPRLAREVGLSHSHLDCSRVRRGHGWRERPLFAQEATVRARGHCSRERPLFAQEATVLTPSQALPLPCCVASPGLCGLFRPIRRATDAARGPGASSEIVDPGCSQARILNAPSSHRRTSSDRIGTVPDCNLETLYRNLGYWSP